MTADRFRSLVSNVMDGYGKCVGCAGPCVDGPARPPARLSWGCSDTLEWSPVPSMKPHSLPPQGLRSSGGGGGPALAALTTNQSTVNI